MKKKLLLIIIIISMTILVSGCKKKNEEVDDSKIKTDDIVLNNVEATNIIYDKETCKFSMNIKNKVDTKQVLQNYKFSFLNKGSEITGYGFGSKKIIDTKDKITIEETLPCPEFDFDSISVELKVIDISEEQTIIK